MFIKMVMYNISIGSFKRIEMANYLWLDLAMLYADGLRLKSYEEDYVPLVF